MNFCLVPVEDFQAIVGKGIKGKIDDSYYFVGNTASTKIRVVGSMKP